MCVHVLFKCAHKCIGTHLFCLGAKTNEHTIVIIMLQWCLNCTIKSLFCCLLNYQDEVTRVSAIAVLLIVASANMVLVVVAAKAWKNYCELTFI